ncbi:MAG TPA: hypothetical protein VH475_24825 [Tepidisphaeraceae bacterium]
MPIRVQCPACGDVTHFADNDAGLAVGCLACGRHFRVPVPAPKPAHVPPRIVESSPLFANLASTLPAAASPVCAAQQQQQQQTVPRAARRRPIRPAGSKSRWRTYGLFLALVCGAGVAVVLMIPKRDAKGVTAIAQSATQPSSRPTTSAAPVPTDGRVENLPAGGVVSLVDLPAPLAPRSYTPATAPVGFVGLEGVECKGKILIDSYDSAAGPYDAQTAGDRAPLVSNGSIRLGGEGSRFRCVVHPGPGHRVEMSHSLALPQPAQPLAARVVAPPVRLDPFAHDSANEDLPERYYRNGNLHLTGGRTLALASGVYYLNDVSLDPTSTLRADGPVTLLVSGTLTLQGSIETANNRAAECRFRVTGSRPVTIGNRGTLVLDLYAPQSACDISGDGNVFGAVVARSLRVTGGRRLHFDEAVGK